MTGFVDPSRSPAPSPPSADDRLREHGQKLVTTWCAATRIGRAYSVGNQVFRTQIENIHAVLGSVLDQAEEVVLVSLGGDLYLNGVRLPVATSNFRFHQALADAFRGRGISGFRAVRGVGVEEISKFFDLFLNSPHHGSALLEASAGAGLERILPAIHATTDPADGADGLAWTDGAPTEAADSTAAMQARPSPRVAGRLYFTQALHGARSLLGTTALTGGLDMRHAKRVVQPLVDGAFASEPVVVGLATLRDRDEYTYAHSVNVCAVAVTMGHFLGMDRRTLADLGVAALLHDVGKDAVADQILHPLEAFTEEERAAAERHPLEGAKLLARSTNLNASTLRCIRVALEHHATSEEGGYPGLRLGWRTSLLSQLVAVADCFVSLHSRSGELLENITPYQALGMMLGPLRGRFEPALLWALVQSVGIYPPGQLVELDDGAVAVVLAPNPHDLSRPHVKVVARADREPLPPDQAYDLLPVPDDREVRRALPGEEYPVVPEQDEAAA